MSAQETFDFIIVGAGATGCVLANRLSAGDARVLLLESGPMDDNPHIHDRNYATGFTQVWGTDLDWQLMTEPQPGLNGRQMFITQGRVVGGGGSVHAMMYVRGDRIDYDHWNYLGNEGWSWDTALPVFKKSEDYAGGANEFHGAGGPMKGMKCPDITPAALAYMEAARELGYEGGSDVDLNAPDRAGKAGIMQFNFTAEGKRHSVADGYLRPALSRPNLTVRTNADVCRVLFEGTSAVGVEYLHGGQTHQARAEREVVVSSGAFFSPKVLMLSGIGPAAHLQQHGVAVVADVPGVGQNLHDHLRLMVAFKSKKELPLPASIAETGMFVRSRSGADHSSPDLQLNFSAGVPGFIPAEYGVQGPHSIFVPVLTQCQSRGDVRLRSANPLDKPIVNPNYLGCDADLEAYVRGVEICREMANTRAFADYNDGEICPGPGADVREYIRNNAMTIWHPAGSCKMGRDALAVVDPQLRVYGTQNLRVADASVMPVVTSGNTHATCVLIGEKCADFMLDS